MAFAMLAIAPFAKTHAQPETLEVDTPRHVVSLSENEFAILHSSIAAAVRTERFNSKYLVDNRMVDGDCVWQLTTERVGEMNRWSVWVARKTAELVNVVDFSSPQLNPEARNALATVQSLQRKIDLARDTPEWTPRFFQGRLSLKDGSPVFVPNLRTGGRPEQFSIVDTAPEIWRPLLEQDVVIRGNCKSPRAISPLRVFPKLDRTAELFTMSKCPHGQSAAKALLDWAGVKGTTDSERRRLVVRYIFYRKASDNKVEWTCLHGASERTENLVQMAIRDHFPERFLPYISARLQEPDADWTRLASAAGIQPAEIGTLQNVIDQDAESMIEAEWNYVAENYGVLDGSPTIVWEGEILRSANELPGFAGANIASSGCSDAKAH